jgi:SNF2 family DNA or RNA helicase
MDVFDKILSNKFTLLQMAIKKLDFIEASRKDSNNWKSLSDVPDGEPETYTMRDFNEYKKIEYRYFGIEKLLDTAYDSIKISYDQNLLAINRVKSNLEIAECPICLEDLNDENDLNFVIFKCCNVILCSECCFKTVFKYQLRGDCSNCRANIVLKDVIFMKSEDFDYDNLLSGFDEENINKNISLLHHPQQNQDEKDEKNDVSISKIDVIMDIVNGQVPSNREEVNVIIKNVMYGTDTNEEFKQEVKKVLIFSNYDGTFSKIIHELNAQSIKYLKLQGTAKQIDGIVKAFHASDVPIVLLINSIKHCNGLNLQCCTDIIFTHKILDKSIESQVCGRGQRIGRLSRLNIHYIVYNNEARFINVAA